MNLNVMCCVADVTSERDVGGMGMRWISLRNREVEINSGYEKSENRKTIMKICLNNNNNYLFL